METQNKQVLIIGGYGFVGSRIAHRLRKHYKETELILGGRNPDKGEALAKELTNAKTAIIDLEQGLNSDLLNGLDLIIACVEDPKNVIRETAIHNNIACITITELAEDIAPTIFLSLQKKPSAPIVLASHWQAGILTLVAKQLSARFTEIYTVESAAVYDKSDPVGPLVSSQLDGFVGRALIRKQGDWQWLDAKSNGRSIKLKDGLLMEGYPMSTNDVPGIAAFTEAPSVRFDFITGTSIGTYSGLAASHDLYIDMEGKSISGEKTKQRIVISDPKGSAHLTSIGVFLIAEVILGSNGESGSEIGGIQLPETLIKTDDIIGYLKSFDIQVFEEAINDQ